MQQASCRQVVLDGQLLQKKGPRCQSCTIVTVQASRETLARKSMLQEDERRGPGSAPPAPDEDDADDGEYGDEDLLASTAGVEENAGDGETAGSGAGSRQAFMCCCFAVPPPPPGAKMLAACTPLTYA